MQENHIEIKKSARYYTLGQLDGNTKEVWFVLHGYAQLAKDILQKFESVVRDDIFIVAPEGLNKFYSRGFAGNPVASWMTSEDRLTEIKDYCNYLNELYLSLKLDTLKDVKVTVLGFSQGVTTASRWIMSNSFIFDDLVIYAGEIAKEFHQELPSKLAEIKTIFVRGKNDTIIKEDRINNIIKLYDGCNYSFIEFDGGHEVTVEMADVLLQQKV